MSESAHGVETLPGSLKLEINPRLEITMVEVTRQYHCAVIDDFLLNPGDAVDFACERAGKFIQPERAYPGGLLPVGKREAGALHQFIQKEFSRLFSFCRGGIDFHTQFSITTLQPRDFTWIQRLCHTDPKLASGRLNFAALIYLFDNPELGGTGFYRWKDPEFWAKMASGQLDDPHAGLDILQERFRMFRDPPCYMTASNEAAELIDKVDARFNRLIFYSGDLPHNAFIKRPELLDSDPARGRLTLNSFASVLPKH